MSPDNEVSQLCSSMQHDTDTFVPGGVWFGLVWFGRHTAHGPTLSTCLKA